MNERIGQQELKEIYQGEYIYQTLESPSFRVERLVPLFDLKKTDVVGDFACGTGLLAGMIHDQVGQYIGLDWSEEFVNVATEREAKGRDNVSFECGDIVAFCQDHPNTFDKAFTLDFSEHIYDDDFLNIYEAIYEALKPGGVLYLHTPNGRYILEILKNRNILKQSKGHVAIRDDQEHLILLKQIGFTSIDIEYLAHYVKSLERLDFLSHLPFLGQYFQARLFIKCTK